MNKPREFKTFKPDLDYPSSSGGALTLEPSSIGHNSSGWTISGDIKEDYYEWVNEFEAEHNEFGCVWGDFEHEVYASSTEAFKHFYKHHTPTAWDYDDI